MQVTKCVTATFEVARPLHAVWQACRLPDDGAALHAVVAPGPPSPDNRDANKRPLQPSGDGAGTGASATRTCRLPAFPSFDGRPGCRVTVLASEPQQRLHVRKDDEPCVGTEIQISVGPATAGGWPTRVSLKQWGFSDALLAAGDVIDAHWRQIVADFQLYLTHEISVPGTVFGDFGATLHQTSLGVELGTVFDGGLAFRCGMTEGDLLVGVGPIRVQSIEQLWTILALLGRADAAIPMDAAAPATWEVTWIRAGQLQQANLSL